MIGAIFEANIKYEKLDELLEDYLSSVKYSNKANVIIDLKSIVRKMYRTDDITGPESLAIEDIASSVINIIGFYRNYLFKHGKYSNIYVLYSEKECGLLQAISPDYKKEYYAKYFHSEDRAKMNRLVLAALKQVKTICKYIPNVFYVDTSLLDEFVYASWLVESKTNKNELCIMLTDDAVMYQCLGSGCVALNLKGIESKLITSKNVITELTEKDSKYGPYLLTLLLAIAGHKRYSLKGIPNIGYKKADKIISDHLDKKQLVNYKYNECPIADLKDSISKVLTEENKKIILANYNVIYPVELEVRNATIIESAFSQLKPVVTYKQFKELNDRIFLAYPLNLNALLKGELERSG